jgi:hypothetical protein
MSLLNIPKVKLKSKKQFEKEGFKFKNKNNALVRPAPYSVPINYVRTSRGQRYIEFGGSSLNEDALKDLKKSLKVRNITSNQNGILCLYCEFPSNKSSVYNMWYKSRSVIPLHQDFFTDESIDMIRKHYKLFTTKYDSEFAVKIRDSKKKIISVGGFEMSLDDFNEIAQFIQNAF